ncbi:hypothetical protein BJ875DRAFT_96520 [Amylocarpus encephaloides]|uniref:Peptidase S54 rhomboid domain-containing protein n=1 Tax=Amylocarpus encephaloides TaxID=45428 RepID=A0A9P7YF74_9HELO|nr:hypothetical protein BJ875DRAFT_96520 [Amylocarpus encephaloides]
MNSPWHSLSRTSCLNTRTILQTCYKVDSLAARLAQRHSRSITSLASGGLTGRSGCQRDRQVRKSWGKSTPFFRPQNAIRAFASNRRIITHYSQLPEDYDSQAGLSFRLTPLSQEETEKIFGKGIDAGSANQLLRLLHGRRVQGTLEDPSIPMNVTPIEARALNKGLEWLRKQVPVDEIACAGLRAEEELMGLEADILADSERLGIYKPNTAPNSNDPAKDPYAGSVFDRVRKAREEKFEREQKEAAKLQQKQANEVRQNTGTLMTTKPVESIRPRSMVELRQRQEHNPYFKQYDERSKVLPETVPEMTIFQRLWPSAIVVLGTFIACYVFTQVYTPVTPENRLWPSVPPSAATIIGIISINAAVLLFWRMPPLWRMLNLHFLTVPGYPRPMSLIGSMFSHQAISHFAVNMAVLYIIGTRVHEEVGRANFLAIYLFSGVFGGFCSLAWFVSRGLFVHSSLGASGGVAGLLATYLALNAEEKVTFFGFPPKDWPSISAMMLLGLMILMEIVGQKRKMKNAGMNSVDHMAHLGGYAVGIASAEALKRRYRRRMDAEKKGKRMIALK